MKKTLMGLLAVTVLGGVSFAGGFNPDVDKEGSGKTFGSAVITGTGKGATGSGNEGYAASGWKLGEHKTAQPNAKSQYDGDKSLMAKVGKLRIVAKPADECSYIKPCMTTSAKRFFGGMALGAAGAAAGSLVPGGGTAAGFAIGFVAGFLAGPHIEYN